MFSKHKVLHSISAGVRSRLKVFNRQVLPESIMDTTFDTVASQSKIDKLLSSKIYIVLKV